MKIYILAALLCVLFAADSAAQERKVWTDADLLKPLPAMESRPQVDPAILAAFKAKADYIPFMGRPWSMDDQAPAQRSSNPVAQFYARQRALERVRPAEPMLYGAQPLYPFVSVLYSRVPPSQHRRIETRAKK